MEDKESSGSNLKPLLGTDEAVIDGKGRVLISKKKRERLGDNFAMCLGENGCLNVFPGERWDKIIADIDAADPINHGRRQYTRLVLATADDELSCDEQGRVVVPQRLRTIAKLSKEVVILGCGDRLEIWDKTEFGEFEKYPDTYGAERREIVEKAYREMKGL